MNVRSGRSHREPESDAEVLDAALEVANARAVEGRGRLGGGDARAGLAEPRESVVVERVVDLREGG